MPRAVRLEATLDLALGSESDGAASVARLTAEVVCVVEAVHLGALLTPAPATRDRKPRPSFRHDGRVAGGQEDLRATGRFRLLEGQVWNPSYRRDPAHSAAARLPRLRGRSV